MLTWNWEQHNSWCVLVKVLSPRLALSCCLNTNTSDCGQWTPCYSHLCNMWPLHPRDVRWVSAVEAAGNIFLNNKALYWHYWIICIMWLGYRNRDCYRPWIIFLSVFFLLLLFGTCPREHLLVIQHDIMRNWVCCDLSNLTERVEAAD